MNTAPALYAFLIPFSLWALAPCFVQSALAQAVIPYPAELDAAAVRESSIADLNREALPIGNGDLNALFWERNGTLCLRVAKNDIWDARVDTSADPALLKVDIPNQKWSGGGGNVPSYGKPYPAPRCAAVVRIGTNGGEAAQPQWRTIRAQGSVNEWSRKDDPGVMAITGAAGASAGYELGLVSGADTAFTALRFRITGTPGARYYVTIKSTAGLKESGWKDSPETEEEVTFTPPPNGHITGVLIYVMTRNGARVENRIRDITLTGGAEPMTLPPGLSPARTATAHLDLRRAVATADDVSVRVLANRNVILVESPDEVSLEELTASHWPAAELGEADGMKWLHMRMPGDLDYAGMEYALAVADSDTWKAVAVVTSWETKENVREAAVRLATTTLRENIDELIAEHEAEWGTYWSASGVKLNDREFQRWWYKMVYVLRCHSKPGVTPPGLWAWQPTNSPPWHGDYHHNYNAWQPNWAPLILNHPDQSKPWVDYMNQMLPRLKWYAKETFDCQGAYVGISSFAFEPDPAACKSKNKRQIGMVPWGYTIGQIGMSAQVLWWHHLYQPDREYLEAKIYPVVKEAALFFCSFAEKCPRDADGKVRFGPSYSPEHGGFGVSNVPFDLAYARFTLKAGIQGAEELGRDGELVARFRKALDILPDYPTAPDADGKPIVVDWTGCKFRQIKEHNITVPTIPVFPGEQITWFSSEEEKDLFRNTLRQTRHRGCNATVMTTVAKARLGMAEGIEELRSYYRPQVQPNGMFYWPSHGYYLTESVGIAAAISELLLQSVDHTVRVFPCWPQEEDASFANLRAEGGFLVTAEQQDGKVVKLNITSTVGGKLRLVDPWTGKIVERDTIAGELIAFHPEAG